MSVLARLVQEREEWAMVHRTNQVRRSRMLAVEYPLLLVLGLLIAVYYDRILAAFVMLVHM